MVKWW